MAWPKFSCKCFCMIFFPLLLVIGIVSAALYVYLTNRGGKETLQAIDTLFLEYGLSPYWCRQVTIVADSANYFNATVVPGQPMVDPTIRQQNSINLNLFVPQGGDYLIRYFLMATSTINIMQCSSQANLMSYIFKGHDIDNECVKLVTSEGLVNKGHDPCNDIILGRELVKVCRSGAMQPLKANIAISDYYLIYYTNQKSDDANVTMKLNLNRPGLDLSNRKAFCTHVSSCTLPLTWGSGDIVVLQTGADVSTPDYGVTFTCQPNIVAYIIIFLALPVVLVLVVSIVCCICRIRKRRRMFGADPVPQRSLLENEPSEEERQVAAKEDDGLQRGYGTFNPINALLSPTAPPASLIPDSDLAPFLSREPPPAYEESLNDASLEVSRPLKC